MQISFLLERYQCSVFGYIVGAPNVEVSIGNDSSSSPS